MSDQNIQGQKHREFKLTSIALKNKNTVYLLTAILVLFGVNSYRGLPKELFPEITWPQIVVSTVYSGNAPEDIENLITRPLEKELENVSGLKEITSISAQDASMIFIEFNTDVEMEDALRRVKDGVDNAMGELPNDMDTDPQVMDIDLSEFPVLNINLSGNYSLEELKEYAETLEDKLEEVNEVSKVTIEGINEREIKVNVDLLKLEAYDLTFNDIIGAIQNENITMSGGEILLGKTRRNLRVMGEFQKMKDIEDIIISSSEGEDIVYLRDVADVVDGYEEPSSFARLNQQPVVSVQVVKKSGENLLSTTKQAFEILDEVKTDHLIPEDLIITITNDQSEQVKSQLKSLENSMIMGIIFVIVVLFFFLGTRNALFVGLAIPTSMFISFVVINLIGFRINMIVLFSLILALGMLVDNAIVVVENIHRFIDEGYKPAQAAKHAVGEIAVPIIASTATTLAAFLPLAMWEGIMGEFMRYLPITLIIVLSSSLFVALVIIPVFASSLIKPKNEPKEGEARTRRVGLYSGSAMIIVGTVLVLAHQMVPGNLLIIFGFIGLMNLMILKRMESWFQEVFLTKLEKFYSRLLNYAVKGKNVLYFFFGTILLLVLTIMLFFGSMPNVVLFPTSEPNYVNLIIELPVGTDITGTNDFTQELEEDMIAFLQERGAYIPDDTTSIVESILTTVGKGDPNDFSSASGVPNKALMTVSFIDFDLRGDISTAELMEAISKRFVNHYPGVEIEVAQDENGPPTGKDINLEIIGSDFDKLVFLADTIKGYIENSGIEGIEGLKMNISTQQPELLIHIDRDKANRYGLNTGMIAMTIRNALFGAEASDFKVGEDEYPIQVRLKDEYRYDLPALENMKITVFGDNGPIHIPLSSVASFEYSTTFSSVRRKDLDRVITLYSNAVPGYNANNINLQLATLMKKFAMPTGYHYEFTGEQQEQAESSAFLGRAMLIALALIMLILVTQFNSLVRTLIIMASIIFSTIGVFGGLFTFRMDFVVIMTGIGIISLAGIVVNNAIVLIDYIELLKTERRKKMGLAEDAFLPVSVATECIVQAGETRLRPVLLTAITTILGLVPMAVGLNFDFEGLLMSYDPNISFGGDMAAMWNSMSWTVIFGLTFSTFLTLIIVPVMYRMTTILQKKVLLVGEFLHAQKNERLNKERINSKDTNKDLS